jgi:hypothetical protein
MSACMATRLSTVSSRVSPLAVEERVTSRLMTSADRRLAAISKVVRVRVEFSKKTLNTLLPRNRGTFLTSRWDTLRKLDAVSRMCVITSRGRPSIDSRWVSSPAVELWITHCSATLHCRRPSGLLREDQLLRRIEIDLPGAEVGADRQLPSAAIGENRELDTRRATIVEQFVDRRARRATGIQHVIDQDQRPAFDIEGNRARFDACMQAPFAVIVAVERNVDQTDLVARPSSSRRRPATQAPPL